MEAVTTAFKVLDNQGLLLCHDEAGYMWETLVEHLLKQGWTVTREEVDEIELVIANELQVLTILLTKKEQAR